MNSNSHTNSLQMLFLLIYLFVLYFVWCCCCCLGRCSRSVDAHTFSWLQCWLTFCACVRVCVSSTLQPIQAQKCLPSQQNRNVYADLVLWNRRNLRTSHGFKSAFRVKYPLRFCVVKIQVNFWYVKVVRNQAVLRYHCVHHHQTLRLFIIWYCEHHVATRLK